MVDIYGLPHNWTRFPWKHHALFYKWTRGHTQLFWDEDQNTRQKLLNNLLVSTFGRKTNGTFVEVGASNGIDCGIITPLADVGWRGLCIEPNVAQANECLHNHWRNPNVTVINKAAGAKKEMVIVYGNGQGSTINEEYRRNSQSISWSAQMMPVHWVEQHPLDTMLAEHKFEPGKIDVMTIDVEGHECEVFKGFSLVCWKPTMLMVELSDIHPDFQKFPETVMKIARLRQQIIKSGYKEIHRDVCNTVFIVNK